MDPNETLAELQRIIGTVRVVHSPNAEAAAENNDTSDEIEVLRDALSDFERMERASRSSGHVARGRRFPAGRLAAPVN